MHTHYSQRHQRDLTVIHPGEYHATGESIIIGTVLGSCVAVALHDPVLRIGGLNHFMLPHELGRREFFQDDAGRYGMYAMELLINALLKMGAKKNRLVAKVFGGGHILSTSTGDIPSSNVRFAMEFLETERIEILSQDMGGTDARKVLFFPDTSRVLLRRFGGRDREPVKSEERSYLQRISKKPGQSRSTDVTFF